MSQYLGNEKVKEVVEKDDISEITLKSGVVYKIPTIIKTRVLTEQLNDHGGSFSDLKMAAVAKDIIGLLGKAYHLKRGEISRLLSFIENIIANDYASAAAVLWKKHSTQITLEEIDKILSDNSTALTNIKKDMAGDKETQEMILQAQARAQERQS